MNYYEATCNQDFISIFKSILYIFIIVKNYCSHVEEITRNGYKNSEIDYLHFFYKLIETKILN